MFGWATVALFIVSGGLLVYGMHRDNGVPLNIGVPVVGVFQLLVYVFAAYVGKRMRRRRDG